MKRKLLLIVAISAFFTLLTSLCAMASNGQWESDSTGWKYRLEDGTYLKNDWVYDDGKWYYLNYNEYMYTGWNKVSGYRYCFDETGALQTGWNYDEEEEEWHYFNEDGTMQKGWMYDDRSWYWFNNRGEMADNGYKSVDGVRYYFLENGQMAQNQYVGNLYMDENGQHNDEYDIVVEAKKTSVTKDEKAKITSALINIPRYWIKHFIDNGWQIVYYPDNSFFAAPSTDYGIYYVNYKLDTNYRKLKVTDFNSLTQAFGEYIAYASGCTKENSEKGLELMTSQAGITDIIGLPDYFSDDTGFYFGLLCKAYLEDINKFTEEEDDDDVINEDGTARQQLINAAPEVCELLEEILYNTEEDSKEQSGLSSLIFQEN